MQPPIQQARLRAAYTLAASRYARWVAPRFRPLARTLLAEPGPPAGPGLDVGSGTGVVLAEWRRLAPTAWLVAVDLTPAMLLLSPAACRVAADAAALPFVPRSFASVASAFALHHLPGPADALREWCRVLAPGGELRLATWAASERTLWDAFDEALADLGFSEGGGLVAHTLDSERALAEAVRAAGFTAVEVRREDARFAFPDAAAYWRWRTAFPGAARLTGGLPRGQRARLRAELERRLASWPGPLVSSHGVLYLRACRP